MRRLTLYAHLIKGNLLNDIQYRGWPIMILQVLVVVVTDPLGTILMFSRFGSIGEWSVARILLIYALAVTAFGLSESLCRGLDYFPFRTLRSGDFDRMLLRPASLTVQAAGNVFHIHRFSRVFSGLIAIAWCLRALNITMGAREWAILLLTLMGGFLFYSGIFLLTCAISFFTIEAMDWIYILTNVSYQTTRCPPEFMPRTLRGVFTFLLPILLISYYPACTLCRWGEAPWKGLLALPIGAAFACGALLLWRFGVRHYKSTGS